MSKYEDVRGVEFELVYDGFYSWKGKGPTPKHLQGAFIAPTEALRAFKLHDLSHTTAVSQVAPEEDLEGLESKADLLGWAKANDVEVPAKYKQPSAIKKFLLGGYD